MICHNYSCKHQRKDSSCNLEKHDGVLIGEDGKCESYERG